MKKDFTQPSIEDFSHPDLRKIYDWKLVEFLSDYMDNYNRLWNEFERLKEEYKKIIKTSLFDELENEIDAQIYDFHLMFNNKSDGENIFFQLFKNKKFGVKLNVCELCTSSSKVIEKNHIIRRTFFEKKKKMKLFESAEYKNHLLNIVFLCPNCHREIHSKVPIKKSKLNRLTRRRNEVNSKSKELLSEDIKFMKEVIEDIESFPDKFENIADDFFEEFFELI